HHSPTEAYKVEIKEAIPAHAGLGSGTQLALAISAAVLNLSRNNKNAIPYAETVDRGERSGIGITSFKEGGFVIDGGRGVLDKAPPTIVRLPFPETWRIILVLDPNRSGVHGEQEKKAFRILPPYSDKTSGHLCRLTLMKLLPSVVEQDLHNFGSALSEIQSLVGDHFSSAQGGTPWSSLAVGKIVKKLGEHGGTGLGQTSWGPTGFVFVANDAQADDLCSLVKEEAKSLGLELKIVRGRNTGATVELL
ncbi:MAG: beta-ribofuranosylaminobenzene 5'-phosphate synthase family protein, partial [Hyphomicrobium sp.]